MVNKNPAEQYQKILATRSVESALQKKNYKKLSELVELADEKGVKKSLRTKAWLETGLYYQRQGHNADAIIALNSSRVLQSTNAKTLTALFHSFNEFISEFRDKFSTEDLDSMLDQVHRLLEFYKAKKMWDSPSIAQGKQIYRRINYLKIDAKSAIETPATHKVARIVKALKENVTIEEVAADYARVMAPIFLELIAKEVDEEQASKKKKAKKKTPDSEPDDSSKKKKE